MYIPVEGIEHLYGDEDRESHGHGMEVVKDVAVEVLKHGVVLSASQVVALNNVHHFLNNAHPDVPSMQHTTPAPLPYQLIKGDLWPSIIIHKPPGGGCHCGHTHIHADSQVTEEEPAADEGVLGRAGGLFHDVHVGGVETKGSGRQSICDQVHPQQLHRNQGLRKT